MSLGRNVGNSCWRFHACTLAAIIIVAVVATKVLVAVGNCCGCAASKESRCFDVVIDLIPFSCCRCCGGGGLCSSLVCLRVAHYQIS